MAKKKKPVKKKSTKRLPKRPKIISKPKGTTGY